MKLKSKYFVFFCIICILFSIATVSANDNQNDALNHNSISNDEIGITDNDELMDVTNKSYTDFYEDIKDCTGTFNIKNNYVYRKGDDKVQLGQCCIRAGDCTFLYIENCILEKFLIIVYFPIF